ncbi:hypothetical protein HGRIS_009404 [Hohenbuehelia grisea]|uniref:Uncharacterized protein n=1 Tax=Hohenbuehelia grisea TaxID=104357 RepID=A0ABR3J180_9AGAR
MEDIDADALQAQIDLSMSFAHDLVSSWIKPSPNLVRSSHKNPEDEIKEYLRKPPRLGVGAPIPESANGVRETARLKQRLTNAASKKRSHDDSMDARKDPSSDDDEESRANVIRKKPKLDPFAQQPLKKKQKRIDSTNITHPAIAAKSSTSASHSLLDDSALGSEVPEAETTTARADEVIDATVHSAPASPSKRSKKKKKAEQRAANISSTDTMSANSAGASKGVDLDSAHSSPDIAPSGVRGSGLTTESDSVGT